VFALLAAGWLSDGKIGLSWVQTTVYENLDQTLKNEFYRVRPSLTGDCRFRSTAQRI